MDLKEKKPIFCLCCKKRWWLKDRKKNQYPAYAVKSDDGKNRKKPISCLCLKKRWWQNWRTLKHRIKLLNWYSENKVTPLSKQIQLNPEKPTMCLVGLKN